MVQKFKETEIGMIPEDWVESIFSEVIDINPSRKLVKGRNAKYVGMADINPFQKKISNYIIKEFKGGSKFQNDDTLVARITPCLENGKTAFVDILTDGEIGFGSTEFIVLSAQEGKTDSDFVYYLSRTPEVRNITIQSMTGTSGRQRVDNDVFDSIMINLPSLPEQTVIAKILSDLDSKIELNQQINKNLEEIGQALFKNWFIDFEFPNEEGKPYKSSGGDMVFNEELEKEIPKGWEVNPLIKYLKHSKESLKPYETPDSDFFHYSISAFDNGKIPDKEKGHTILSNKFVVKSNSILVCKLNPRFPRIWAIGSIDEKNSVCSTEFQVFQPTINEYYSYLYFLFTSNVIKKSMKSMVTGTSSSHQRIRPEDIHNLVAISPSERLIIEFDRLCKKILSKINFSIYESQTLSLLRDSLLPKLMSGKIRVPVGDK